MSASSAVVADVPEIRMIAVDRIEPSPLNRHCADDDQGVLKLAASIKEVGLINPIDVRPMVNDRFEIICGERRWRAFRSLDLGEIPCIVKNVDDTRAQIERITENLQRQDLTPMEQGEGVVALLSVCGNNYAEVAKRLDYSDSWVRRRAKLPNLTDAWRAELANPDTPYGAIRDHIEKLEEIAILPPATQDTILTHGYLIGHTGKTEIMRQALAKWFMNLEARPWTRDWEKKSVSGRKRCDACMKRSDKENTLFDDLNAMAAPGKNKVKLCLDPDCWDGRVAEWCKHLLQQNAGAAVLWDGYPNAAGVAYCKEHFGRAPLPQYEWESREADVVAPGENSIATVGVFVGGARAGKLVDIWLRDGGEDDADDEQRQAEYEAQQKRYDDEQRRRERIVKRVEKLLPESALSMRGTVFANWFEFAIYLLNWAAWFGVGGTARYRSEIGEIDIMDTEPETCPGLQLVWSELREEIVSLVADKAQGEAITPNEERIVKLLASRLRFEIDSLAGDESE